MSSRPLWAPDQDRVVPFDHPLYVLYPSGTTGRPKCIVHRAGGILLEHLCEHQLHSDVRPGDPSGPVWSGGAQRPALGLDVQVLYGDGSTLGPGQFG